MINLYIHGGSGNHGCEAIVRTTVKMIGQPIRLFSSCTKQDIQYGIDHICEVREDLDVPVKRGSAAWFTAAVQTKLTGKIHRLMRCRRKMLIDQVSAGDICISIGGDNYCYAGTELLAAVNHNLRRKGAKTVLWGCSVEPESLEESVIAEDLAAFDLITARESISYEALKKINPNTLLVADPAFTLDRKDLPLPEGWSEGNTVGLNVSPLILSSSADGELVMDAYRLLIRDILEHTDCSVALIPHVVWDHNDDRVPLGKLYDEFRDTGRVLQIGDHNCMELKGYIARCRLFIGARTHATIAAYSSGVPTLVLGYSVKSKGIARDLFGTEEHYVLPVQHLKNAGELTAGFRWLMDHEQQIRGHLAKMMPGYIREAQKAAEVFDKLLQGES